jgi:hypothetical protein
MVAINPMVLMTASDASAADPVKIDLGVYPEPSLQPLAQFGATVTDPVLGAGIFGVIDSADVPNYVRQ